MTSLLRRLDGVIDWLASGLGAYDGKPARPARHLVVQRRDVYELYRRAGRAVRLVVTGSLEEVADHLKAAVHRPVAIELRLDPGKVLRRSIDLPLQSASHLDAVVALQAERILPWPKGQAVYAFHTAKSARPGMIAVDLIAMAAETLAALRTKLATLGLRDVAIGLDSSDPKLVCQPQFRTDDLELSQRRHARRRLLVLVWISTVSAGGLLLVTAATDQNAMIAERQVQLAAGASHLGELERRAGPDTEEAEAMAYRVLVLEALSRSLPDHTYLESLSIHGTLVRLEGLSADANSLIGLLEEETFFGAVRHDAGVIHEPDRAAERFAITAELMAGGEVE